MGDLGNIFDADDEARAGTARGPDLQVTIEVPRGALGDPAGYVAEVPRTLEHEGRAIERAPSGDDEAGVRVFLPASLPDGAVLRLRSQGGVHPEGVPGDLMVRVTVIEPRRPLGLWIAVALLAAVVAVGLVLAFV